MAIGISELGRGDDEDIYPGLYTQATLDDLLALAREDLDGILLSLILSFFEFSSVHVQLEFSLCRPASRTVLENSCVNRFNFIDCAVC